MLEMWGECAFRRIHPRQLLEVAMHRLSWGWMFGVVFAGVPVCFAGERAITPDLAQINDGKTWNVINAEFHTRVEDGKQVVQLKPKGHSRTGSVIGLALVGGLEFGEGTIDIDLKGKGKIERSFLGVAFNVADGKTFEAVYFRPFNFLKDDKTFRARAVQYIAWPEHTWENLRQTKPGVYESAVNPIPNPADWFHARIDVTKKKVSVFVNEAKEPCLVVDRLAGHENGRVGLWVDSNDGAFANLKILSTK
jgi:hypothetical protein